MVTRGGAKQKEIMVKKKKGGGTMYDKGKKNNDKNRLHALEMKRLCWFCKNYPEVTHITQRF